MSSKSITSQEVYTSPTMKVRQDRVDGLNDDQGTAQLLDVCDGTINAKPLEKEDQYLKEKNGTSLNQGGDPEAVRLINAIDLCSIMIPIDNTICMNGIHLDKQ